MPTCFSVRFFSALLFCAAFLGATVRAQEANPSRLYYQAPTWKPRAVLPAEDALKGDFWPKSPATHVDYNDPGFSMDRLGEVPAPGVHPRVLLTPADVEVIRAKVALGDKAPPAFRVMWERVSRSRSAFYALVARDDALGKALAAELVGKIKTLEPKLDAFDARPDHENMWIDERSTIASGDPNPPTEIWSLLDYDYLAGWMSPQNREAARRVIARLIAHRISNFMMVPDHFMINNHQGFGMEYIRLMLLIEGEPGFDQRVWERAAQKARAMLDWYLDDDGMSYESIKGWLNVSAFVAVGHRQHDLLEHSHLRAKMRFFQAALRWEDGQWHIRDEMRASAFHVIWMMHYYHPRDQGMDLLYQSTFSTHPFLTDAEAKWPNPVGIVPELLLLYADSGITAANGKPQDWTDQARIDSLHLPLTWQDNQRGYVDTRNTWKRDDLHLGFACKQDFYYGGHEGSENGRLTLWRDGVNWIQDVNMLATKATFLQNMLTVDGKGVHWPPAPGTWLGVKETSAGLIAASDDKDGYSYTKSMQIHPLDFPSARLPYYAPFAEANFDLTRDVQVAFNPRTIAWNDGYAHTDYGPWSGETRLVEGYRSFNPMQQAYRTVQMARGENPYVLVLDDARKDGREHEYEWNITVPDNAVLVDASTPEIVFQNTEPAKTREDDLVLGLNDTPRDPKTGKYTPRKGDPLFLVRVLWRNSNYGFPVPRLEQFQGYNHLTIPAISTSPEFRVLLYACRQGDPLPKTSWNRERTELTVDLGAQHDVYHLAQTDGGRTILSMERGGQPALSSSAPPARPVLTVRGETFDANSLRYQRNDGTPPVYLVDGAVQAMLHRPAPPAVIRYTLDGTEPTEKSPEYVEPVNILFSEVLEARVFDPAWPCAEQASRSLVARFFKRPPAPPVAALPDSAQPGLLARVYEVKTVMWNDRGFFDAGKIMMPDLRQEKPLLTAATRTFELPHAVPATPQEEQRKGFYRFTGWFNAPRRGVYQFAVDSCGPVTLDVGGRAAIEHTGIFHQQQDVRKGEAILDAGWQPIELVVCDPQFWNMNSLEPMPFSVTYRINGGDSQGISSDQLRHLPDPAAQPAFPPPPILDATPVLPRLESGVVLNVFDRTGKRRAPDFLDIDDLTPLRSEQTSVIEPNPNASQARCYDGYFHAPVSGVYGFDLPMRGGESAGLGALQASFQNQLRVGNRVVVQHGIPGRVPLGLASLRAGWYPISIRLGPSDAPGTVTYPDGQSLPLTAALLSRPVRVSILPAGDSVQRRSYEVYGPTPVSLSLPGAKSEIHYTLDGRVPENGDSVYAGPLTVDKDQIITACAFEDGQAVTAPARVEFKRVDLPEAGLLGHVTFDRWNGTTGALPTTAAFGVWILPDTAPAEGLHGGKAIYVHHSAGTDDSSVQPAVDVNVSRGASNAGFKFSGIQMRENAITVAVWFKTKLGTGKLFGKEGYNAFGKSYKTVSCGLAGGRISAGPGHVFGAQVTPDAWHHLVMTGDDHALTLYLDGEQVGTGPGSRDLSTDALDFFTDHPAVVDSVRLYNRVLAPGDVRQLYTREKP